MPDPVAVSVPPAESSRRDGGPKSPRALAEVVADHREGVWRYLRMLGCNPDEADDLLQDTFVVLLRRAFVDAGPRQTAAFLRQTAKFLFLKSRRRRPPQRDVDEADRVFEQRCGDDDGRGYFAAAAACLDELPVRSRRIVAATYAEDLGRDAVACELGMTSEGIKTALRRLRSVLRECIERRLRP